LTQKLYLLISLVFLCQVFFVLPVKSTSNQFPQAIELGRYNLFQDKYWAVHNKTIQQLRNEGYDVPGDANSFVQANYTYLDYTFKSKIVRLSWPNVTLQITEGTHDLNVTVYRTIDDEGISERLGSYLRSNLPLYIHPYPLEVRDPDLGVGFNPSVFTIGNTFPTLLLTYTVNRTEILNGTPWGQNDTYVCEGYFANATHSYKWTTWCDARSGLFLKLAVESKTPTFTSYEEQKIVKTGVEGDRFDVVKNDQFYQVLVDTNSTLSSFLFDSSTNKISLTVDGPMGTSGMCNITVPKSLVLPSYDFEVYVDGQKTVHTVTEDTDNYYISFSYEHSTHTITINLVSGAIWTQWWFWTIVIMVIAVLAGVVYLLKRKKPATKSTPSSP